jgi:capsular polysaccharide transport system permease protein
MTEYKTKLRSPLDVTLSVWRALFLREALSRLFFSRGAWFWLVAEPVFHVSYMLVIFTVVRVRHVGGIDTPIWLVVGMLAFFMFRQTGTQTSNAISANRALLAYRQVKPVDTVLVRSLLEVMLLLVVMAIMVMGLGLMGFHTLPADPLAVIEAFGGLWILGLSYGLILSVVSELLPDLDRLIGFLMMPLYMISGVIFPLGAIPEPYLSWLLFNPITHGIEAARLAFAPHYHAVNGLSLSYLWACALVGLFFGLALHRRFALRLRTA